MALKSPRIPKYCLHKGTGQAYVRVQGARHYLGVHGSEASIERYNRFVAEMVATDRATPAPASLPVPHDVTVAEVLAAYLRHAEGYYQKSGQPTAGLVTTEQGGTSVHGCPAKCTIQFFHRPRTRASVGGAPRGSG